MSLITRIQSWGDHHHPKWLDYFRIALGVTLIWKGIAFALNLHAFTNLMNQVSIGTATSISFGAHLIIVLHIIGGLLITIGSRTRISCLLNIPILIGAVFFVNMRDDIFRPYAELWLSYFVLLGLICFLIEGDGILSIEYEKNKTFKAGNGQSII
ncbi:DoxX family protein [Pedobacter sp.]|uniref:DoxX family protein n=1 Tax=Pedobacter sp. TaxID=1411316 RepID=UPI003D7FB3A3